MKYTKRLLISISFFALLFTGGGCTSEEVIGGGGRTKEHPVVQTIHATKSDFSNTKEVDVPLTRTTTDGYSTTFVAGDQIGLFAIKGGAIVDDINNKPLTYTVTDNGTTSWSLPIDTKFYYYEGVTYIAYYPFKNGVTIDASKSVDEIVESLVNREDLQPATDQSAGYASSDLMIATGSADATDILNVSLSLKFEHQFSLLVMIPKIYAAMIIPPKDAGFTYRYAEKSYGLDSNAQDVTLSGIKAFKMSDGSFRVIITAAMIEKKGLSVDYQSEKGKWIHYQGNNISSLGSGQYYALTVKNTILSDDEKAKVRSLEPGDFVFHGTTGIEIYPGDGALQNGKIPDYQNAVGIVVTCDPDRMTDAECNKKGWNHAYVIGLVRISGQNTWGKNGEDAEDLDNYTKATGSANMNGYSETTCLVANHSNYSIIYYILTYIRNNAVIPDNLVTIRSDWFIPSVGQYYDLLANLCGKSPAAFEEGNDINYWKETKDAQNMYSRLQSHYAKLGKQLLLEGDTWSSSEYDVSNAWSLLISNSDIRLQPMIKSNFSSPNMKGYGFFAF